MQDITSKYDKYAYGMAKRGASHRSNSSMQNISSSKSR